MKRIAIATAVIALSAAGLVGTAGAANAEGNGYGKQIKDGLGSYGQLVSTARAAGHIEGSVGGAKNFVESGLYAAHGGS